MGRSPGRPPWAAAGGALWALIGLAGLRQSPEKAGQGASRGAGAPPHIVATIRQWQKYAALRFSVPAWASAASAHAWVGRPQFGELKLAPAR